MLDCSRVMKEMSVNFHINQVRRMPIKGENVFISEERTHYFDQTHKIRHS